MQTFIPGEVEIEGERVTLNRVQFSAPGLGLVVVGKDGLHVHDTETVTEPVFDPETGEYENKTFERPCNTALINALNDHRHVALKPKRKARAKGEAAEETEADEAPDEPATGEEA